MSDPILSIRGLRKTYGTGVDALKSVDLDIRRGEIFALLGPNGAGKTTLINIVCGIVTASAGEVLVDGKNWQSDYRHAASEVLGEQRHIPFPRAKRGQGYDLEGQAVEQVGAEFAPVHLSRQILVGRRDDPHVDRDRLGCANARPRLAEMILPVLAIDQHMAAGRGDDPADDVDEGRLAGAVGAEQRQYLTLADVEVDALQRLDAIGIGLPQPLDADNRVAHSTGPGSTGFGSSVVRPWPLVHYSSPSFPRGGGPPKVVEG